MTDSPATFLKYTQWKNREIKPVTVDTPIPAELLEIIKQTKTVGLKTWLVRLRAAVHRSGLHRLVLDGDRGSRFACPLYAARPT